MPKINFMQRNNGQVTTSLQKIQINVGEIIDQLTWLGTQTKNPETVIFANKAMTRIEELKLFAKAACNELLLEPPVETDGLLSYTKAEGIHGKHGYKFLPSHQLATV